MTNAISTPSSWVGKAAKHYLRGRQKRLEQMVSWEGDPEPGTRWIPLLNGKRAIVDESDYEFLNQWNWRSNRMGYVQLTTKDNQRKAVFMHREILKTPEGMYTDHCNHIKWDNRRCNLRICTHQQNHFNRLSRRGTTSRFRGVRWHKKDRRFVVYIRTTEGKKYIGGFKTEEEAALRYNEAAKRYHGEFALLNQL